MGLPPLPVLVIRQPGATGASGTRIGGLRWSSPEAAPPCTLEDRSKLPQQRLPR